MTRFCFAQVLCVLVLSLGSVAQPSKPLQIYFVDVEGGQATLFVSPEGRALLIDTGWPGGENAKRIAAAAKLAGITKLDYVLITHYHVDHVGGVPSLVQDIPVAAFLDHGQLREPGDPMDHDYANYLQTVAATHAKRTILKPGDKVAVGSLQALVVTSDGKAIDHALPGAGGPNPYCKNVEQRPADQTENARSLGTLLTFGKLRIVDLGDLTWDKELPLMCPDNKLGKVDIYIVSHHGFLQSGSPALVHGIAPRVAIMDNGAKKGGSPGAWQIIMSSRGLEDLWQLHYSVEGGKDHNVPEQYIANIGDTDQGNYLRVAAYPDGHFTIFNSRTGNEKAYPER